MPMVHYGSSGANQIGNIAVHPGTYGLRQSTLRSLIADIGGQIAQNRFKWIFVMNGHGAPTHHVAVNEACDFVSETFTVTMLNISGLFNADAAIQSKGQKIDAKYFSAADLSSFGSDMHAGVSETSAVLAVRPDLVRSNYKTLPTLRADSLKERRNLARKPGWPGYFSAPARANADYGRDIEAWWVEGMTDLILQAVRGEDLFHRRDGRSLWRTVQSIPRSSLTFSRLNANSSACSSDGWSSASAERVPAIARSKLLHPHARGRPRPRLRSPPTRSWRWRTVSRKPNANACYHPAELWPPPGTNHRSQPSG